MPSKAPDREAYVWVWLPGETNPVVTGRLAAAGDDYVFNYARSYLARPNAIALYEPELPLRQGVLPLLNGLHMPSCIRDAAPDAWGRRVILNRHLGRAAGNADTAELDELTYLLDSGSDRVGALDFQESPTTYIARKTTEASFEELISAAEKVEKGIPLNPQLDAALLHGSSIGGARPKALIESHNRKYVAKFSSQSDLYGVVKAEYVAMRLAAEVGIDVAPVRLERAVGKDVLLVERFDRERTNEGWRRRAIVSALTLLELDEMTARYASYEDLATIVRHRFIEPKRTLKQMFARMLFNVLCGNTDDHARNHAAYWDGRILSLTPAYDICPQARSGGEADQAMLIIGQERFSQIAVCLKAASVFLLSDGEAAAIAHHQITTVRDRWALICDAAKMTEIDRSFLWRRQFLNPFAFEGAPSDIIDLVRS
jgi:serine/threonine-protein kinase HipA